MPFSEEITMKLIVYNYTEAKIAPHSKNFIRAIHLKCFNFENKRVSNPILFVCFVLFYGTSTSSVI